MGGAGVSEFQNLGLCFFWVPPVDRTYPGTMWSERGFCLSDYVPTALLGQNYHDHMLRPHRILHAPLMYGASEKQQGTLVKHGTYKTGEPNFCHAGATSSRGSPDLLQPPLHRTQTLPAPSPPAHVVLILFWKVRSTPKAQSPHGPMPKATREPCESS